MRRASVLLLMGLLMMVSACRKDVSPEDADKVLKELAWDVVKMEDPNGADQLKKLQEICDRYEVDFQAMARYVTENPEAEKKLQGYMDAEFDKQYEERKEALRVQLEEIGEDSANELQELEQEEARKREKLELDFDKQIARLKSEHKVAKGALVKELEATRGKVTQAQAEAEKLEKQLKPDTTK